MAAKIGTYRCIDCGVETTRRIRSDRPAVCFDCGQARAVANAVRLAAERRERRAAARIRPTPVEV